MEKKRNHLNSVFGYEFDEFIFGKSGAFVDFAVFKLKKIHKFMLFRREIISS